MKTNQMIYAAGVVVASDPTANRRTPPGPGGTLLVEKAAEASGMAQERAGLAGGYRPCPGGFGRAQRPAIACNRKLEWLANRKTR